MIHAFIREELVRQFGDAGQGIRILYGGSMRPANAAALLAVPNVGGGLIGGASLKAEDSPSRKPPAPEGQGCDPHGGRGGAFMNTALAHSMRPIRHGRPPCRRSVVAWCHYGWPGQAPSALT